jgi:hypothetical protein
MPEETPWNKALIIPELLTLGKGISTLQEPEILVHKEQLSLSE